MSKIPVNPLKWFKKEERTFSPPPPPTRTVKQPAHPKKSGNVFMHLINLQKNLQAIELAFRQGLDYHGLVQKTKEIVSALKLEAEVACEEDLAQGAGQVLACLETILDNRLDLDEEGIGTIFDFVALFKDALGEAVPGIARLNHARLEEWNVRYQEFMSRMKPIEEDIAQSEPQEKDEPLAENLQAFESIEEIDEPAVSEAVLEERIHPEEEQEQESAAVEEEPADAISAQVESLDTIADLDIADGQLPKDDEEELQVVESLPELDVQDIIISDTEKKSPKEMIESGETDSDSPPVFQKNGLFDLGQQPSERNGSSPFRNGESAVKTPVQLEEVERLKKKLLHLHEKQELLSSKMSGILGDLKKTAQEQKTPETVSVENLEIDDLEDLIFIGRKKG
jgi:hypothetical protein